MSKRKHNVAYLKPEEPKFLRELKEKIGYKEGPTVDTKREALPEATAEDYEDREEEKPVVVVLKSGDLTADEAQAYQDKQEEEEANTPADLTKKIVFRKTRTTEPNSEDHSSSKKSKKTKHKRSVLSFDNEEEDIS
ncbi:uncharacterized protein KIAA1143 homolog [Orussus abietinus]|uniref:uncharacterized protein KIAA1143 homolog n=1 Tax=Orussus abietinus TaxID=222816 RepID=UPI0006266BDA|nr:uncharacterized protein KIAA1143 homolog [Orussus abietinus]